MKKQVIFIVAAFISIGMLACNSENASSNSDSSIPEQKGQSAVSDDVSQQNIVQVASGSKDHSTLVAAVKAAEYVDVLANAGPFTVFAPTNAAFDALPKGTVEGLLKPDQKDALRNILEYHVFVGVLNEDQLTDGRVLNMVNLDNATIANKDGKMTINGINIGTKIKTSNGVIYVVDAVMLPPAKK